MDSLVSGKKEEIHSEDEDDENNPKVFELDGETFTKYQDFVAAKRKRNLAVLTKLGFGSSGETGKRL